MAKENILVEIDATRMEFGKLTANSIKNKLKPIEPIDLEVIDLEPIDLEPIDLEDYDLRLDLDELITREELITRKEKIEDKVLENKYPFRQEYLGLFYGYICNDNVEIGRINIPFDEYEFIVIWDGLMDLFYNQKRCLDCRVRDNQKNFTTGYIIKELRIIWDELNNICNSNKNFGLVNEFKLIQLKSIRLNKEMQSAIYKFPNRKYKDNHWYIEVIFFLYCLVGYVFIIRDSKYKISSSQIDKGWSNLVHRLDYLIVNEKNWKRKEQNKKKREERENKIKEEIKKELERKKSTQFQIGRNIDKSQSYVSKQIKKHDLHKLVNNK